MKNSEKIIWKLTVIFFLIIAFLIFNIFTQTHIKSKLNDIETKIETLITE